MRITYPRLLIATMALSFVAVACGGGGDAMGGNSGTRLTDEAFCAKIAALNDQTSGDNSSPQAMLDSLKVIQEMAKVAPTAELQQALEAYTPLLEEMSKLDQNDPEALSTIIGKMVTPELTAAGKVLSAYTTDVCGIKDGSASSSPPTS